MAKELKSKVQQAIKRSSKGHMIYKIDGKRVPSCTTITGVMAKPFLIKWANNLGLEGVDSTEYVDKLARAGTLAHYMVECFFKKKEVNYDKFSSEEIAAAKVSFSKFTVWQKKNNFIPLEVELYLTSKRYMFGGQLDLYGILEGKRTLLDVKTSKAVYGDQWTQVAGGYNILLTESDRLVEQVKILRLGRSENEGFQCADISPEQVEIHKERFVLCRQLYEINKKVNR
jgi:hypothetical protein